MLTVGSLFSGIGGLDLGLERAGMRVLWQCESDPYCRAVLRKHWPDIPCFEDVRAIPNADERGRQGERGSGLLDSERTPFRANADGRHRSLADSNQGGRGAGQPDLSGQPQPHAFGRGSVDVLAGGFPCQPVSLAGRRRGAADERWLWPEFARLIRLLRPRYALVENVPGLLVGGGMAEVLGDLAALGYDAEWDCVAAAHVGAPHLRYRVFIVAYAGRERDERRGELGDVASEARGRKGEASKRERLWDAAVDRGSAMAITSGSGRRPQGAAESGEARIWWSLGRLERSGWWRSEPDVGRVAHGVPSRVERLRALGNAVVPQVAEVIGRLIIEHAEGWS